MLSGANGVYESRPIAGLMLFVNECLAVSSYLVQLVVVTLRKHILDLLLQILLRNGHVMTTSDKTQLVEMFADRVVGQQ